MIVWISPSGNKVTLNDDVKNMSFEELKETFEGREDYVSLAKFLGIKKTRRRSASKKAETEDK